VRPALVPKQRLRHSISTCSCPSFVRYCCCWRIRLQMAPSRIPLQALLSSRRNSQSIDSVASSSDFSGTDSFFWIQKGVIANLLFLWSWLWRILGSHSRLPVPESSSFVCPVFLARSIRCLVLVFHSLWWCRGARWQPLWCRIFCGLWVAGSAVLQRFGSSATWPSICSWVQWAVTASGHCSADSIAPC